MHAPCSVTVLLAEPRPGAGPLATLKPVLEQADIGVVSASEEYQESSANFSERLPRLVARHRPSLIILSVDGRSLEGDAAACGLPVSLDFEVPVIVAAQNFEAPQIRTLLELGASDFIIPPFSPADVLPRIWRLVKYSMLHSSTKGSVREKLGTRRVFLLGESPSFLDEVRKLPLVARCDVTVMIWGETGTGKELFARAVHYLSPRHELPFVPIDCSAIPPELAESELFGHERGAFTGAVSRSPGLIAAADQGTLFLDEVDGLSLSVQAKLLRFLQQREYRPLGSNRLKRVDVRVIAATNGDLQQRVRNGQFREDLFYRLNVVQIPLPPLRQRREDIALLAQHFAAKYSARFKRLARHFSPGAMTKMLMHQWPGNIRELENVVEAAVALCDGPVIDSGDLSFAAGGAHAPVSFKEAKARVISEFERDYLVRVLCACGGNVSEAARAAGKNRRALWELIRKYGVDVNELRDSSGGRNGRGGPPASSARFSARNASSG